MSTHRHLYYGSVKLVPAEKPNCWHVPGDTVRTTEELIAMANRRGLSVVLVDVSPKLARSRRLN